VTEPQGALLSEEHCKVTVIGTRKRVDLALPARTPIAAYVTTVARLVEQPEEDDAFPPAWSLGPALGPALRPASSLAAAGVLDGSVLYLRDVLEGESDEPLVLDIDEQVGVAVDDLGTRPWNRPTRAAAALCVGVLWLTGTALAASLTVPRGRAALPVVIALVAGLGAMAAGWLARVRPWPLAAGLRMALALCAIPDLAVAGALLGPAHAGFGLIAVNAAFGVLLGSVAVAAAAPGTLTRSLPVAAVITVSATVILVALHANALESAAFVTVLCIALGALAPWSVGRLALLSPQGRKLGSASSEEVATLVERAHRLLVAGNLLLSGVAGAGMVVLADSSNPYAVALAGTAAIALLARSSGYRLLTEALPGALSAAAGLAACAFCGPGYLHGPWWVGPLAAAAAGLLLALAGLSMIARRSLPEDTRPAWHAVVASLGSIACVPLAVGVFGVYAHLVSVGNHL
jgi:type VII secretion integral membrane protein EccD